MKRTLLTSEQILTELKSCEGWELTIEKRIRRTYKFQQYKEAVHFVVQIAEFAEASDHHPDIELRWGSVSVSFSTHSAGGITQVDFDSAAQVNQIVEKITNPESRGESAL